MMSMYRAIAVGVIALGSKAAMLAKSAGGAGGVLKGLGALGLVGQFPCDLRKKTRAFKVGE